MRLWGILALLCCSWMLLEANEEYYDVLFGTSDFALITQQNCARFIETDVGIGLGQCPIGLSGVQNLDTIDSHCPHVLPHSVRSHLIRDVNRRNTPRLLFVYVNRVNQEINYGIEPLSLSGNYSQWMAPGALKQHTHKGHKLEQGESLVDSVFDTRSNVLYLIIKSGWNKRKVRTFYIGKIFHDRADFTNFDRDFVLHKDTNDRFAFVENPYEHTVYYMKKTETHSIVYKLPLSELFPSLVDGIEGELVLSIPDPSRTLIWAHKGAIITMARSIEDKGKMEVYYLRNATATTSRARRCAFLDNKEEDMRRLITLFDWDYCMLKYGGDGTGTPERECPVYYDDPAPIEKSGSSSTIYFVIIALLMMVSLVLGVYVCWLRRNLDDSFPRDEHKPVPYYPSGQPLDSTFDMSVDRWDQY